MYLSFLELEELRTVIAVADEAPIVSLDDDGMFISFSKKLAIAVLLQ